MQLYVKMMATLAPCDPGLGVNACEGQESSHPIPPRPSPGLCRASFSALHLLGGAGGSELLRGARRGRGGSLWQPGPSAVRLHDCWTWYWADISPRPDQLAPLGGLSPPLWDSAPCLLVPSTWSRSSTRCCGDFLLSSSDSDLLAFLAIVSYCYLILN